MISEIWKIWKITMQAVPESHKKMALEPRQPGSRWSDWTKGPLWHAGHPSAAWGNAEWTL